MLIKVKGWHCLEKKCKGEINGTSIQVEGRVL